MDNALFDSFMAGRRFASGLRTARRTLDGERTRLAFSLLDSRGGALRAKVRQAPPRAEDVNDRLVPCASSG